VAVLAVAGPELARDLAQELPELGQVAVGGGNLGDLEHARHRRHPLGPG